MFDSATLLAYLVAVIAIVLAPGPGQALVLTRTIGGGRDAGLATTLGLNIGTLVHTLAAAFGLSAILSTSAVAFAVVKYVGAVYLIYLGIQALRSNHQPEVLASHQPVTGSQA
jgi:threonine/homoserine/homoserine lactone efflux protein